MADLIVGNDDCKLVEVVDKMLKSSSAEVLFSKWEEIARKLNIPADVIYRIQQGLRLQTLQYFEAYHSILVSWMANKSGDAKLGVLLEILDGVGAKDSADHLRSTFVVPVQPLSPPEPTPKFIQAPLGLQDFLKKSNPQSALIISTVSCSATLLKIRDTIKQPMQVIEETSLEDLRSYNDNSLIIFANCKLPVAAVLAKLQQISSMKMVFLTEETIASILPLRNVDIEAIADDFHWADLHEAFREELLNQNVLIQDREITLKEALIDAGAENSIGQILSGKALVEIMNPESSSRIMYSNNLLPELKYYVPRTVISAVILNPQEIFKTSKDIFVFSGKHVHPVIRKFAERQRVENASRQISNKKITTRFLLLSLKSEFDDICKMTNNPIHWLNYEDGEFTWVKSRGDLTSIRKAIDTALDYAEDEFVNHILSKKGIIDRSRMPVCISDLPGMGKSVLLSSIGRKIMKSNPKTQVKFVILSKFMTKLSSELKEGDDISEVLLQSLAEYSCSTKFGTQIFKTGIQSGKLRLELLLDGYDEINSSDLELAKKCLQTFTNSFPSIRVIVTTRPHFLAELENILQVLGYRIMPFNFNDQIKFLTEFWARKRKLDEKKLKDFSKACLNKLNESMTENDDEIAGIPLQCLLIGKVFKTMARNTSDPENELPTDEAPEIGSITELFERVIDLQLKRFSEKFSEEIGDKDKWMMGHAREALNLLFPELVEFQLEEVKGNISREYLLKVGILVSNHVNETPEFIHRLFAEFFVAWFTHQQLKKTASNFPLDTILSTQMVEVEMKGHLFELVDVSARTFTNYMVAYFLNNILKNEHSEVIKRRRISCQKLREIIEAGAHDNLEQIFHFYLQSVGSQMYENTPDGSAKDFLTVAVWKSSVEILETLFPIYKKTFSDPVHGLRIETYKDCPISLLHVALCRGDVLVVDFLQEISQGFSDLVKASSLKLLLHSCVDDSKNDNERTIRGKCIILQNLIEKDEKKNLLKERDIRGRTPLLCSNIHIDLLKELVQIGADVLTVDNVGNGTVLHKATQYLSKGKYSKLVEAIPDLQLERMMKIREEVGRTPLHCVVGAFDPAVETLQRFHECGADVNSANYEDDPDTILMTAVKERRNVECLKQLIDLGASWNIKTEEGQSLLHIAVELGQIEAAKLLLVEGADVNEKDEDRNTPFHLAISQNHVNHKEMLAMLTEFNLNLSLVNDDQHTYLHFAALHKRVELARVLIQQHQSDVNARDWRNNTPLHFALFPGKDAPTKINTDDDDVFKMAKLLIDNRAEINALNRYRRTPLVHALKIIDNILDIRTLEILKLPEGTETVEAATEGMRSLLSTTCLNDEYGFKELVKYYLAHGADLGYDDDPEDRTFLHIAALNGNQFGVRFLCQQKRNVNSTDFDGNTPLHLAVQCKNENMHEIVKCLVAYGCELNLENKRGLTALRLLINENVENCKIETLVLLNGGEDTSQLSTMALKSLIAVAWNPQDVDLNLKTAEAFFKAGANLNFTDEKGNTLLHIAARDGCVDAVGLLVDNDISTNVINNEQNTPLHLALLNGSKRIQKQDAPGTENEYRGNYPKRAKSTRKNKIAMAAVGLKFRKGPNLNVLKIHKEEDHEYESRSANRRFRISNLEEKQFQEKSINVRIDSQLEIINFLLEKDAHTDSRNKDGYTPLEYLIYNKDCPFVFEVFNALYNREYAISNELLKKSLFKISSELNQFKSDKQCIRFIKELVQKVADCTFANRNSSTLLHNCSEQGNLAAVQFFVSLGCDIDATTKDGDTILHLATEGMTAEQFHVLLEIVKSKGKGFLLKSCNKIYECSVLHSAVWGLELLQNTLSLFIECEADINAVSLGDSVLLWAIHAERSGRLIKKLIDHDVNVKFVSNSENENALMCACRYGNLPAFKLLIPLFEVNLRNETGQIPLHRACVEINTATIRIVQSLVENGADVNAMDLSGNNTPLHTLFQTTILNEWKDFMSGAPAVYKAFKYLLLQDAKINPNNEGGATSLHYGAGRLPIEVFHDVIIHLAESKTSGKYPSPVQHVSIQYCSSQTNLLISTLELFSSQIGESHSTSYKHGPVVLREAVKGGKTKEWIKSYLSIIPSSLDERDTGLNSLLHIACDTGNLSALKYLLYRGCAANWTNSKLETPLHVAFLKKSNKQIEMIQELLQAGADTNMRNIKGNTPLSVAVRYQTFEEHTAVLLLLRHGANINAVNNNNNSVLHRAIRFTKSAELVKVLIEKGADINTMNSLGCTSIHMLVAINGLDTLKLLTLSGTDVHIPDEDGDTALHDAVTKEEYNHEITKFLIEKGADVNSKGKFGQTALHRASTQNHLNFEAMKLLMSSGADVNIPDEDGDTALHDAVTKEEYNHEITKFLIEKGADVNSKGKFGQTALHRASAKNHRNFEAMKLLISSGADVNSPDEDGDTALHYAVTKEEYNHEITKFLIEKGADVNSKGNFGQTALHWASTQNHRNFEAMRLLISSGANVNIPDEDGDTALHYAVTKEEYNHEITKFLIQKGADVNSKNKKGQTALHRASTQNHLNFEAMKLLISSGADVNIPDEDGDTAFHDAVRK